jgi:hypothetical protein
VGPVDGSQHVNESKKHQHAGATSFIPPHSPPFFTAPWPVYFSEILHSTTVEEAARHYVFCSGYLQALRDTDRVTEADFSVLRDQLHARLTTASEWLAKKRE